MTDNGGKRCDDRQKDCDRRFEAIEKDVYVINKPEIGALASIKTEHNEKISKLHEKINTGLSHRPRWTVFWSIITVVFVLTFGSYTYTYESTDKLENKYEQLVTKEDFKDFKREILQRLSQLEEKINYRR